MLLLTTHYCLLTAVQFMRYKIIFTLFLCVTITLCFAETTDDVFLRGMDEYRTGNYEAALDDFVLVSLLEPGNKEALKYSEEARKRLFEQRGKQLTSKSGEQRMITGPKRVVQPGAGPSGSKVSSSGKLSSSGGKVSSSEKLSSSNGKVSSSGKLSAKVEKKLRQASDNYTSGNIPQAIKMWEQALEIEPDNVEAARSIAIALATGKKLEQERKSSVEEIREKTIVSDNVKKKLDAASMYYSSGDFDMAVKTWKEVLALSSGNQEAKKSIQMAEFSRKHLENDRKTVLADEARRSKQYVKKGDEKSRDKVIESKMNSAYQKYSYGNIAQAMSVWKDVLAIDSSYAAAAQQIETATQIEPIYKKAQKSYRKKDWLKANDGFLRILEIDPECPFAKQYLNNIDKELKRIIDNESGSREAYYAAGFFYYNQKNYNEAIGEWRKAIAVTTGSKIFSLTESDIQDYISRANTYIEKERLAKMPPPAHAVSRPKTKPGASAPVVGQKYQVTVDVDKSNEYYNQGLMLFSEGKITDAIGAWELALRYNPDNHKATRNIAKAKNIIGK